MSHRKENNSDFVAEARLGSLEPSAVDVLRRLVDQFDGKAELLYRRGEWLFSIHASSEEGAPFKAQDLPSEDYGPPGPAPPEGFAENEVEKVARRTLGVAGKP